MKIRMALYHDNESGNWGFRVPSLNIVGGGCSTRDEAKQHALDAVAFALDDQDLEAQFSDSPDVEFVEVALQAVS